MRMITLLIISGSLSACGHRVNNVKLPLPARPVLPAVTAVELKACPINVRRKIIVRDVLRKAHCTKLETIIKINNQ